MSRPRRQTLVLFGLALLVRLVYSLPRAALPELNDMGVYDQLATNLLNGRGYVSALEPHFQSLRPPGYPFLLATIYLLFGHSISAVLFVHSVMGAATCVLVQQIGRLCVQPRVGLLAGALCACNPELLHWNAKLLTETTFTFLLALLIWLAVLWLLDGRRIAAAAAGAAFGAAVLVRPGLLLFVPVFVACLLWISRAPVRRRLGDTGILLCVTALVLLPWSLRNLRVHGELVPVSTMAGLTLFVSLPPPNLPESYPAWLYIENGEHRLPGGYDMAPELFGRPPTQAFPQDFDEIEISRQGRRLYVDRALGDPLGFTRLLIMKASMTFNALPKPYRSEYGEEYGFGRFDVFVRYGSALYLALLFSAGAAGAVRSFGRGPIVLVHVSWLLLVALQVIFRPALRYLLPGLAIGSVVSAVGILYASGRSIETPGAIAPSRADSLRPALAVALGLAVLANLGYQAFVLRAERTSVELAYMLRAIGISD